ncbi:MAG TPA: hypothetical protein VGN41_17260, partial [Streptosporangiaceae bacterium]
MTTPADDRTRTSAHPGTTLDDLHREFGDRWDIARITGGYRAIPRDTGGHTPIPRYGRTPAELAESIRMMDRQPPPPESCGVIRAMNDVPDFRPPPPPSMRVQADALRTAFPKYAVNLITTGGKTRFEVVARPG